MRVTADRTRTHPAWYVSLGRLSRAWGPEKIVQRQRQSPGADNAHVSCNSASTFTGDINQMS